MRIHARGPARAWRRVAAGFFCASPCQGLRRAVESQPRCSELWVTRPDLGGGIHCLPLLVPGGHQLGAAGTGGGSVCERQAPQRAGSSSAPTSLTQVLAGTVAGTPRPLALSSHPSDTGDTAGCGDPEEATNMALMQADFPEETMPSPDWRASGGQRTRAQERVGERDSRDRDRDSRDRGRLLSWGSPRPLPPRPPSGSCLNFIPSRKAPLIPHPQTRPQ